MKKGFTLAEVLITIAIIGIVAMMTIPALISNYNTRVWNIRSDVFNKKYQTAISTMNVNGELSGYGSTERFIAGLSKYMKILKTCQPEAVEECFYIDATINTSNKIKVTNVGPNRIQVIKVVKNITGLGLKEAKNLVDQGSFEIDKELNEDEYNSYANQLSEVGATIENWDAGTYITSNIKNLIAKNLGKVMWDSTPVAVQFNNGINALITYNPECAQNSYNNLISPTSCTAVLFDVTGFSGPNAVDKDLRWVASTGTSGLTLVSYTNKIQTIKIIKNEMGLSLKEAKELVEKAPIKVMSIGDGVSAKDILDLKTKLEAVGATVSIH